MCLIWVASLFNGTGLGIAYHTTEYFEWVMLSVCVFLPMRRGNWYVRKDLLYPFLFLLLTFFGTAFLHGYTASCLQYLSCFLLIYLLSNINVRTAGMKLAGFAFAGLGAGVLALFRFGSVFSGWNTNSIAMIGLFSYLIFAAAFFNLRSGTARIWLLMITVGYVWLLWPTDSRSCEIAILLMCLIVLFCKANSNFLRKRWFLMISVLIPFIIAIAVCLISANQNISELNAWSYERFSKPIFNGRDEAWMEGLRILSQNFLFGTGNLISGVWHNAAIFCLTAYGAVGYCLWVTVMVVLLSRGIPYLRDPVVRGCMTVFLIANFQQSFELGMMAPNYNFLIYLPLGLLLGRVRYLKERLGYGS